MSDRPTGVSRIADLRVLWHLLVCPVRGATHGERLESFYRRQAAGYDSFRSRMLHGRDELMTWLDFPDGGVWVDLGAGTGHNLFAVESQARRLGKIRLVDLSASLLAVAADRVRDRGLSNVTIHEADATELTIPADSVDVVTLSYSLSMIPDWFEAIAMALRILKPGGVIAVCDFYVSRKYAGEGRRQHGWLRRSFWPLWFAADNVLLSPDPLAMLHRRFDVARCEERLGRVPYLPLARVPHFLFLGKKPSPTGT